MIQRIQSLLFLFATLSNLGVLFFPFWQYQNEEKIELISGIKIEAASSTATDTASVITNFTESPFHMGIFGVIVASSLLVFIIIFLFQNRKQQMNMGYIAIVLLLLEIGLMSYFTYMGPYEISSQLPGMVHVGFAFPVIAVILVWMGIRKVKKDDDLIKSVDRIR